MVPLHASLSLWTWSWDPTVVAGTIALAGGYAWLIRGRDRVTTWSPLARAYFAGGLLALFLALESPIDVGGDHYLFSLHMLQHLLLAMIVPPLLILGLPEEWRAFNRVRVSPLAANVLGQRGGMSVIGKIAYLGFAGVPPTILGLAFILSPNVLYPFYAAAPRVTPLAPLDDQLVAGLVMFGLGNLIYFVAISVIFFRLDDKSATAGDGAAGDGATIGVEPAATMRR